MNKILNDIQKQIERPRVYVVNKETLSKPNPKYNKENENLTKKVFTPCEVVDNIVNDLKNTSLTIEDIASKNCCSETYVHILNDNYSCRDK